MMYNTNNKVVKEMQITSIILAVLGILLFIYLLPTLLWLAGLFIIVIIIVAVYQRHKVVKAMKEMEDRDKESTTYTYTYTTSNRNEDDVIDVEYKESEE